MIAQVIMRKAETKFLSGFPSWTLVVKVLPRNKNGPLRGHVQEAKLVGNSGKAMQEAVPTARTVKEVTLCVKESEGHNFFCGLLVTSG